MSQEWIYQADSYSELQPYIKNLYLNVLKAAGKKWLFKAYVFWFI